MSEHYQPSHKHAIAHNHLDGSLMDRATHTFDSRYSPRIIDELVEREVAGRKVYGEVFAIITPDAIGADKRADHPVEHQDSLCLVRYADTKEVGIASRAYIGDKPILHPGKMLKADERIYFGREGDNESVVSEKGVLGRAALTGVNGAGFSGGVSRIHGSIDLYPDGRVIVTDGREELDPSTRHDIDIGSSNGTRVTSAADPHEPRVNLIAERKKIDAVERERKRMIELFGAPTKKERDRFGNLQDRLSLVTEDTERDAAQTIRAVEDEGITAIIAAHLEAAGVDPSEQVAFLRSNTDVRLELGAYLVAKAEEVAYKLPERLQVGNRSSKAPNHPGYPGNMSSQEYAALLAISMLDGTFVSSRSTSDTVEFVSNNSGSHINGGQHRLAALTLLDLNKGIAPEHIKTHRTYR